MTGKRDNKPDTGEISAERLNDIIERIEALEEDKAAIQADIKGIYTDAKAHGFDPKIIRKVIQFRKMQDEEVSQEFFLLELYLKSVGIEV